jgi:hypothetical protein
MIANLFTANHALEIVVFNVHDELVTLREVGGAVVDLDLVLPLRFFVGLVVSWRILVVTRCFVVIASIIMK